MTDGVSLYADVYRPAAQGPHPVVLISHPYDKTAAESNFGYLHPSQYARRGYIAVSQDCRGRYRSEGDFHPFVNEASDLSQTIDWCAALEGSDGRVATYGFSYPGINQMLAAQTGPPALQAIAPAFTGGSPYSEWFYVHGAFSLAFASSWANFLALDKAARRKDDAALAAYAGALGNAHALYWVLPLTEHPALTGEDTAFYQDWLAHPTLDEYWKRFEVDHSRIGLPGLHVGGWWDVFIRGTVRSYRELARLGRAPQKLVIGPWNHMPWAPLGGATGDVGAWVVDDWQLRFWDQVLKGEETGVFDSPVTVYVMNEGWRDLDGWPPSAAEPTDWYIHSAGRAQSAYGDGTLSPEAPTDEPPDVFTYDPLLPTVSAGGHSCCVDTITPMGPADQDSIERTKYVRRLHERGSRARPGHRRRRARHDPCRNRRPRHRFLGAALRRRRGRPLDEPARGHRACALSRVGRAADPDQARRGQRVPHRARPHRRARARRPTAASPGRELRLPAVRPEPQHRWPLRTGERDFRAFGNPGGAAHRRLPEPGHAARAPVMMARKLPPRRWR